MKKKILSGILVFILLIGLTGCGKEKYNNITVDGNEISLSDMVDEYKGNAAATAEKYSTKAISYTGEIEAIDSTPSANLGGCYSSGKKYYEIKFVNDNINVLLYVNDSEININDYKVGDVITVNTNVSKLYHSEESTLPSIYSLALANYSGDSCEWGNTPTVITINE